MTAISTSMVAQRQFSQASGVFNNSLQKLATGSRINRGSDDPAGLISSEHLAAALASLDAESRAIERADAVANVADGALAEISGLLADANAATVAMANTAGMSQAEREAHEMEVSSAKQAIDRIASTTTFNGQKVLDGTMTLSVGGASVAIGNASAVGTIEEAISTVATMRGQIGAFQANALAPMQRSNAAAMENTASAYSVIRDTDYAAEMANLNRARVLKSAAVGALGLANSSPAGALRMLM